MFQRFRTEKIGYTFAAILCLWFVLIAGIGVNDFAVYDLNYYSELLLLYTSYPTSKGTDRMLEFSLAELLRA